MKLRIGCQVGIFMLSLFGLLILGPFMETVFFQASLWTERAFGGKEMPAITAAFYRNYRCVRYVMLIPWIGFVGLPWFSSSATRAYWEVSSFVLRFAAFITIEILIFTIFFVSIVAPWFNVLKVLDGSACNPTEQGWCAAFCLFAACTALALVWRAWKKVRARAASGSATRNQPV